MNDVFYTERGYQLLAQEKQLITACMEDYLEMIYRSINKNGAIRVKELATQLNVKPSSVSKMLAKLVKSELIDYVKYGTIKLSEKGSHLGAYLLWRHNTISQFFSILLGENSTAFIEAELTEHILSFETVKQLEWIITHYSKGIIEHRNEKQKEHTVI